ncbi:organic solvent tolerance protein OstA [secondary endosymbiont of Heteropsylla cubana]|uniref:LPS-assembly protein LptD n=1 Tax=secondary endosymbiont of Heteropsylla cubana TaxID=134287 RepID=J3TGC1_9ENTR|nr:LPS assembly protein LptD [secondary endosymbiont of Heteropsylla cubana]AFP85447.1 organic solvent tolerance protein OstA [secondary endosymbiont of Heteropsylla cubana]
MKKRLLILITSLIGSLLYSQNILANSESQCLLGIPIYNKPLMNLDTHALPLYIQSTQVIGDYPKYALFSGKVNIQYGNSTLKADKVYLRQEQEENKKPFFILSAIGNVEYFSNEVKLQGFKAWSNLKTKDIDFYHGSYQLVGRQGRGKGDSIKQRQNNRYSLLKNSSFTLCLPGDDSWSIVGSKVILNHDKQIAEVWNARFKVGKIPVLYSPYLQIPIGEKRRSGFLMPHIKYGNNNGFEFSIPYYLNLAPNYDITIIPTCIRNGEIHIQTEFHYLTLLGEGFIECVYFPRTLVYKKMQEIDTNRWLLSCQYQGVINQTWRLDVDYKKNSNLENFDDLDLKSITTTTQHTNQKFSVGYFNKNWNTSLSYQRFPIFLTSKNRTYHTAPQLSVTYHKHEFKPINFKLYHQATKFIYDNNSYSKAIRLHLEPSIGFSLRNDRYNLDSQFKLMATHYQQTNIEQYNAQIGKQYFLQKSVFRLLPMFSINKKMHFQRKISYLPSYTQTLETRFQYLFTPYKNQSNIQHYDSIYLLYTDYSSLFREYIYTGLDYISPANQLVTGVSTRIYNKKSIQQFSAHLGQIYYFSKTSLADIIENIDQCKNHNLLLVGESYLHLKNHWGIRGGFQYHSHLNCITLGNAVLEYRKDNNHIFQINYRYSNPQYTKQALSTQINLIDQKNISQLGITGNWLLTNQWSLCYSYYYNTNRNQLTNKLVGLEYKSCCWGINVGYEKKISSCIENNRARQYDNKLSFNISLRNLHNNDHLGNQKMLISGKLPYQKAF